MEATTLVAVLAFGTLFAVAVWGMVSQKKVEERKRSDAPKSTLAADKRSDGTPVDV
jgi:hypothetical protein